MKILLTGGGTGGHITPLLAVARELKRLDKDVTLIAVCEKGGRFNHLYNEEPAISETIEIRAGKYRRYAGLSTLKRLTDIKTMSLNSRDVFYTVKGYRQARKMLKDTRPDGILIKGGFVGVPVGLAAARLKIP